ncbi:MAG TPA: hypothetical protein VFV62_03250, partial [Gaiellaceae bacterium]|nr:hypothetical protein [Gaiellaceae bacterium]
ASNAAFAAAIAATGGSCQGAMRTWAPLTKPDRATVSVGVLNARAKKGQQLVMRYIATAAEDVTVKAGFVPASTPAARIPALLTSAGVVDAYRLPPRTATGPATKTAQLFAVALSAVTNPKRVAVFTSPVTKAAPAAKPPAKKAEAKSAKDKKAKDKKAKKGKK